MTRSPTTDRFFGVWVVRRQIDAADRQIDQLVYELYGLTDEETRIVEESTEA